MLLALATTLPDAVLFAVHERAVGVFALLSLGPLRDAYRASSSDPAPFQAAAALAVRRNFFAYQLAMLVLGAGSMLFCSVLYRARLVPRPLAVWGFAGYAGLLVGAVLELVA